MVILARTASSYERPDWGGVPVLANAKRVSELIKVPLHEIGLENEERQRHGQDDCGNDTLMHYDCQQGRRGRDKNEDETNFIER